jgi:hypothetical protein
MTKIILMIMTVSVCVNTQLLAFRVITNSIFAITINLSLFLAVPWDFSNNPNLTTVMLVGSSESNQSWLIHLLAELRSPLRQLGLSLFWYSDREVLQWQNMQTVLENHQDIYRNLEKFVYFVRGGSEFAWEDEIKDRVQMALRPITSSLWKGKNVLQIKHIPSNAVGPIDYESILRKE